ncbi:MAG: hypothetical protein QXQ66_10170 [Candidatus Hadarchaeum sp.]
MAEEYYAVFLDSTFLSIRRGKKDREALAEDLKAVCRAETGEEAKEVLRKLSER